MKYDQQIENERIANGALTAVVRPPYVVLARNLRSDNSEHVGIT